MFARPGCDAARTLYCWLLWPILGALPQGGHLHQHVTGPFRVLSETVMSQKVLEKIRHNHEVA